MVLCSCYFMKSHGGTICQAVNSISHLDEAHAVPSVKAHSISVQCTASRQPDHLPYDIDHTNICASKLGQLPFAHAVF